MRRALYPAVFSVAALLVSADPLTACGDKFLQVGRGLSYQQAYAAIYPSSILIYAGPSTGRSAILRDAKFQATLLKAGHQLVVANDETRLHQALEKGRFDIVLADFTQMATLVRHVGVAVVHPLALPVMDKLTRSESDVCKQQFTCELKSSDKPEQFLRVIDGARKKTARAQPSLK